MHQTELWEITVSRIGHLLWWCGSKVSALDTLTVAPLYCWEERKPNMYSHYTDRLVQSYWKLHLVRFMDSQLVNATNCYTAVLFGSDVTGSTVTSIFTVGRKTGTFICPPCFFWFSGLFYQSALILKAGNKTNRGGSWWQFVDMPHISELREHMTQSSETCNTQAGFILPVSDATDAEKSLLIIKTKEAKISLSLRLENWNYGEE